MSTLSQFDPHHVGPWVAPGGIFSAFLSALGYLPIVMGVIAGAAATCYYIASTLDTDSVKAWRERRRTEKLAHRIARLQARQTRIIIELQNLGIKSNPPQ